MIITKSVVGVTGFEPTTTSPRTKRATTALHPDVIRLLMN